MPEGVAEDGPVSASLRDGEADASPDPRGDSDGAQRLAVPPLLVAEVSRWQREACPRCGQRAMFYCPFCCRALGVPDDVPVPEVSLPFQRCDIVFDDAAKKATSVHAKVLAPAQVRLIDLFTSDENANRTLSRRGADAWPSDAPSGPPPRGLADVDVRTIREIPEYDPQRAVVLFPDDSSEILCEAVARCGLATCGELTLVVIDAPWRRAQVLRKHPRLAALRSVRLAAPPASRFWRYHAEGPGCVSTIEALGAIVREAEAMPLAASASSAAAAGQEAASSATAAAEAAPPLDGAARPAPAAAAASLARVAAAEAEEDHPLLFFFTRQLAHIAARSPAGGELPTDKCAKERRSARVRQKDRAKRLRPMGSSPAGEVTLGAGLGDDDDPDGGE